VAEPDDPTLGAPAAAQLPRHRPSTKRRAPRNDSPDTPGPKIAEMTYDVEDVD